MPLGKKYVVDGLILRDGRSVVLMRDDGGRWRLDIDRCDGNLLGRRVRVFGTRSDFDLLDVSRIDLVD